MVVMISCRFVSVLSGIIEHMSTLTQNTNHCLSILMD